MSLEEQLFAFESTPYRPEGTELVLLRDAAERWVVQSPDVTPGDTVFEIVYRMSDGRFVRVYGAGFRRVDALKPWETPDPIEIGFYGGWRLIQFFRDNKIPLPADLAMLVDEAEAASNRIRPLEELLQIDFPIARAGSATHQVDWRWLTGHLQKLLVDVINELRTGTNKYSSSDSIHWLCRFLSQRYDVDVAHWWGAKGTIPPATVDVFELPWPKEFAGAVSALKAFRERAWKLLRISDKQYRSPGAPAGYPNDAERGFVWKLLVEMLPELETHVSDFLKAIPDESTAAAAPPETSDHTPRFIKQGATWRVSFRGNGASFREVAGFWYLRELVSKPGQEIAVEKLVKLRADRALPSDGSQQPVIDDDSNRELRARIKQLDAAIDEAMALGNEDNVAGLEAEKLTLVENHSRNTDHAGKSRKFANQKENMRSAVAKAIGRAIDDLGQEIPDLQRHLQFTVRCGVRCVYDPAKDTTPYPSE